ncbi:pectin lyase-like protein [Pleurotus eryngii]|uniref:galacturonan 1,4-alpha-galacturonidase n=1 Tax=Pleurotus eryngii TaxID=5323 RepID=A0A9P5ZJQ8_PLEER|nr:pectin lyase-like protein [Pleurotus eryngii]
MSLKTILTALLALWLLAIVRPTECRPDAKRVCSVRPLGAGRDDTEQVLRAIDTCGHGHRVVLEAGSFNITRKMTWDLRDSRVDVHGVLSFQPDIEYWLNATNVYRVVSIQNQASWFVVTGENFVIDGHNTGGIDGNGQPWWSFFATRTRADGDGRPISFTLWRTTNALVKDFHIHAQPFWCNTVAESQGVIYDGMKCNASNSDPSFAGKNIVINTDGIDTYRSTNVSLLNWDITCGDDCLAIKGNSTDLTIRNITCRGGIGIAFGSLGQYANMSDNVRNVDMRDLKMIRIDPKIQPNMDNGVYFKSWTGTVNGSPPTGGGGGTGVVDNITISDVLLDCVNAPLHLYQTYNGHSGDAPSQLKFGSLHFSNWSGTACTNKIVDIECSPAVGCQHVVFEDFSVAGPQAQAPRFICQNVRDLSGLGVPCNSTGSA